MKEFFTATLMMLAIVAGAQGIDFFEGSWDEALAKAQAEEKLIFVDAYATWCGPCKRMAKTVFTDAAVGEYYNQNFINLKLDMEKPKGRAFGDKFPVSAFPTLFYIDEKGELLKKVVGGRSTEQFIALGRDIAGSYDRSGDLAVEYDKGNRDYALVLKYVKALNNANKSSTKVSNNYLRKHKAEMTDEQRAEFLYEALNSADSRIFTLFIKDRDAITKLFGQEAVEEKIEGACQKTILNAIDFESRDLLEEAKSKMSANYTARAKEFGYTADYTFAKALASVDELNTSALTLAEYQSEKEATLLNEICAELKSYESLDPSIKTTKEKIAKLSADKNKDSFSLFQYAQVLLENDKKKKAIKTAKKALKKSEEEIERELINTWISTYEK